jgi:hypothetical protein
MFIAEAPGSAGCAPRPSSEEVLVHDDLARPNGEDRIGDEGDEDSVGELENGARRTVDHADDATVPGHGAMKEIRREPLLVTQLFVDQQELVAKR